MLLALLVGAVAPPIASATSDDQIKIIIGAPTGDRTGSTQKQSALFELAQPGWPGRNECRLDGAAWKPCGYEFATGSLSLGDHRLDVRQTNPVTGKIASTDTWTWKVIAPRKKSLDPSPYCHVTFEDYYVELRYPPLPFPPDPLNLHRAAIIVWNVENTSGEMIRSLPNQATVGDAVYTRTGPTLWPWWDIQWANYNWTAPTVREAFADSGAAADNTWPQGSTLFMIRGWWIPLAPEQGGPGSNDPAFFIRIPYEADGSPKPYMHAETKRVSMPQKWASCLRIIPPTEIVDNGNGTLSATFGWVNHSGLDLKTGAIVDVKTRTIGAPYIETLTGSSEYPQEAPTEFPGNSSGTWTYTFTDPGVDTSTPISWVVSDQRASLYVVRSKFTPSGTASTSPFTHVDPSTPYAPSSRPIAPGGSPARSPVSPTVTGGNVTTKTSLRVRSRILHRRGKTPRVTPGQHLVLQTTIRNTGKVDAMAPRICDVIPLRTRILHAPRHAKVSGRKYCWSASRLAAGAAVHGRITLKVLPHKEGTFYRYGLHANRVTVKATNTKTVKAKARFFIRPAS
ncbi:MAG: hypothetical protein ACO3RU_10955 [Planctomycetota bacterium]